MKAVLILMICVIVGLLLVILVLSLQNAQARKRDKENLHKADYLNAVQGALIGAHNNPDFVDQALKIVAGELEAETVLLLNFSDKVIEDIYYWPSKDEIQAKALLGLNIRTTFPEIYDVLAFNQSIYLSEQMIAQDISSDARDIFLEFEIERMLMTPIMDNAGALKGAIAIVNAPEGQRSSAMLECLTKDFFMALTNLENHNIIKKMGTIDYLTGLKNRNSYESEMLGYYNLDVDSLGCVYVDANGLHELNNTKGHKAGDMMLCAIADALRKVYGTEHTYRIGGDEFAAFKLNGIREDLASRNQKIIDELERKGYSVSVGFQMIEKNEDGMFDVEKVVAEAERVMYYNKKKHYGNEMQLVQRRGNYEDHSDNS